MRIDEGFHKPAPLRKCPWPPDGVHWQSCHSILDAFFTGLHLVEANARQRRIDEDAVRDHAFAGAPATSFKIRVNNVEVVLRHVCEVRTPRALSDCPYVRCGCFQAIIHPDVTRFSDLDSGALKTDSPCVRGTANTSENRGSLKWSVFRVRFEGAESRRRRAA